MSKSILQIISSCSRQKTPSKNTKYSRNETFGSKINILKIAHKYSRNETILNAKAIAFEKSLSQVKN